MELLGSHKYTFILPANKDTLISFFPICIPLISFNCPITLAKTSRTILNKCGESGEPCLVADFCGIALSFSPFKLMLAILAVNCLYYVEICPLYS